MPLTLLLPSAAWRAWASTAMVGMHVGIWAAMSAQVGLVFATTLPCYWAGFSCNASLDPTNRELTLDKSMAMEVRDGYSL